MTEEQLQLLRATRPSGQDEHEEDVVAARAAVAQEPALEELLQTERELDLAMLDSLRGVEPPAGFETALLTAMRAARGAAEPPSNLRESVLAAVQLPASPSAIKPKSKSQTTRITRAEFTRRAWIIGSAAAGFAMLGKVAFNWREKHAFSMRRLTAKLAFITKNGITLSLMSMDPQAVARWLNSHNAPRLNSMPEKLNALGRKGCHIYNIEAHDVSLECFLLPDMRQLHLFSTLASELTDAPSEDSPVSIRLVHDRTLATWTKEGVTVFLFSEEPAEEIRNLLA
jgi:hypothetical protein